MGSKKKKKTRLVNNKEFYNFYIGKGSAYGNPYEDEEDSLEKYKEWFFRRLKKARYKKAVDKMRGRILACTCQTFENCHGQIIVDYLDEN